MPNIKTEYSLKPIPTRNHDWLAYDDDTYDGAPDSGTRNQIGHGATEQENEEGEPMQLYEWDEGFMDLLRSAARKRYKRLLLEQFIAVAAWLEYLRYGGDDPRKRKVGI